jgi:hypothetical protein
LNGAIIFGSKIILACQTFLGIYTIMTVIGAAMAFHITLNLVPTILAITSFIFCINYNFNSTKFKGWTSRAIVSFRPRLAGSARKMAFLAFRSPIVNIPIITRASTQGLRKILSEITLSCFTTITGVRLTSDA